MLSNINPYTYDFVKKSGLFDLVDGYVLSYQVHMVKPYESIYKTLLERYNLNSSECLFVDDKKDNVDTANKLEMFGYNVKPDDYDSVIELLKCFDINF